MGARNYKNYLGYSDWRLPNAKELQSIFDYTRSPDTTNSAAIDPLFNCTAITAEDGETDYPWYWASTTRIQMGGGCSTGAYICFGQAYGYWSDMWQDVHGAGAQRSDLKSGDMDSMSGYTYVSDGYYFDSAPQGDAARINIYVRLVRTVQCGEAGYVPGLKPFIDTKYYKFSYGDPTDGDRIFDSQFATCTKYLSTTMNGNDTVFGVNFADGTITDNATGLTWMKADSGKGLNWG